MQDMEIAVQEDTTSWAEHSSDAGLLADTFTLVTLPHSCSVFTRTTGLSIIVPNNIILTRGFINLKITFNYL